MKRIFFVFFSILFFSISVFSFFKFKSNNLDVGANQGDSFILRDINSGSDIDLSNYMKNKVILLDFWATWCPPCVRATPALVNLQRTFSGTDFSVIGVSTDQSIETVRRYVKTKNISYPVFMYDAEVFKNYDFQSIPTFFLLDREGKVKDVVTGFSPDMEFSFEKQIKKLIESSQI